MSHLDARLNLARKSQILTRDLSLPIVPRLHPQEDERYCFIVEWLDPHSGLTMRYQMLYGPAGAPQHNGEWDRASPDPIETGTPLGSPSHD